MVRLELLETDARILTEVLRSDVSELYMEISHTDRKAFRDGLKERKEAILRVLEALESQNVGNGWL